MAIAILQAFATHVWQLFLLRGIIGLTSGYIPNAMALSSLSGTARTASGWALSTLSTAQISGVIGWRAVNGAAFVADHIGLRAVFLITAMLFGGRAFWSRYFLIKKACVGASGRSERLSGKTVLHRYLILR